MFKGRFSLHRVTTVQGDRDRITGIFAYALRPGVVGRVERTKQIFGRVSPIHLRAAEDNRIADALMD
jgi:hypothetical protein